MKLKNTKDLLAMPSWKLTNYNTKKKLENFPEITTWKTWKFGEKAYQDKSPWKAGTEKPTLWCSWLQKWLCTSLWCFLCTYRIWVINVPTLVEALLFLLLGLHHHEVCLSVWKEEKQKKRESLDYKEMREEEGIEGE